MKRCAWMVSLLFLTAITLPGCDGSSGGSGGSAGVADPDTPEGRARQNSEEGAAALAESDRGVDDDGEKVWKQDARAFYDSKGSPNNATFEMPWDWAADFTNRLHAAGAPAVWVTRISDAGIEGRTIYISDDLLVVLPDDPAARAAVFALYNSEMEDAELQFPDVGQQYIFLVAD